MWHHVSTRPTEQSGRNSKELTGTPGDGRRHPTTTFACTWSRDIR
nr:hypothetical protein [Micrococcus sp. A1]